MKEPLLWFILIGAVLFFADRFTGPQPIIVDETVRTQIANLWETQMGMAPTEKELDSLVHNWVREEIFYREALRLGLENEDTIIRRRLVQKLTFLVQDVDEDEITRVDLEAYYGQNPSSYTLPDRYSLSQIFFPEHDQATEVAAALTEGEDWKSLGESSLLPRTLVLKSEREITSTFGTEFTSQLGRLQEGQWTGPISSTFGFHLVKLDQFTPTELTPLAYVEKQVLTDLLHQRRQTSLDEYYEELLDQYDVQYQ